MRERARALRLLFVALPHSAAVDLSALFPVSLDSPTFSAPYSGVEAPFVPASACVDGVASSACWSSVQVGAWFSARISLAGMPISYASVHASVLQDEPPLAPFEVWLGASPGDPPCGHPRLRRHRLRRVCACICAS